MGLTTWENAPDGKILKADVSIAKNYLSHEEMSYLERIVTLYLDYAELQAERKIPMSMEDWARRLDGFLEFNGNEILTGPGKISAEEASPVGTWYLFAFGTGIAELDGKQADYGRGIFFINDENLVWQKPDGTETVFTRIQ
jgi:hypothetical protein